MRKNMARLVSLMLAVIMTFALTVTAFGANKATDTTIKVPAADTHTYEVYQIFTGELADGVLSNVEWGINGTGYVAGQDTAVDSDILKKLAAIDKDASDTTKLKDIETYVNLKSEAIGTVKAGEDLTVTTGYYLLKDVDAEITGSDTFTKYVVQVVGPTEVKRKADTPEMVKKVKETNDSTGAVTDWQDASDYDFGDNVPYRITTQVVSNYDEYEHYYLTFNDEMNANELKYNNDAKAYVVKFDNEGKEIAKYALSNFGSVEQAEGENYTFKYGTLDLKKSTYTDNGETKYVAAGDTIVVEYSAELLTTANVGSTGNKNTANMEFSNNPNKTGDGTKKPENPGKTPDDTVITFVYKTVVNKVDQNEKPLANAGFTLYKFNAATNSYEIVKEIEASEATTFEFSGLDAGKYKLSETKTPSGYNTIKDIEFVIESEWGEEDGEKNLTLTKLTVKSDYGEDAVDLTEGETKQFTVDMNKTAGDKEGNINTNVKNQKGSTLPSTGGMGTTLIYALGIILMLGAGIVLVTRAKVGRQ